MVKFGRWFTVALHHSGASLDADAEIEEGCCSLCLDYLGLVLGSCLAVYFQYLSMHLDYVEFLFSFERLGIWNSISLNSRRCWQLAPRLGLNGLTKLVQ